MPKILYTSDIHGNEVQYRKLVDYTVETSPDFVIIGGDIAPKNFPGNYVKGQRRFLEKQLPKLLKPLKDSDIRLFLMMGNDDCSSNLPSLEQYDSELYHIIHGKRIELADGFYLVGYSFVPITPFGIKDWEKYDLSDIPRSLEVEYQQRKYNNYKYDGFKSSRTGFKPFLFTAEMESEDSIQRDLETSLFLGHPDKTIYVIHTPPDQTNLDMTSAGEHVGSFAVRQFIEKSQPYLTLHGHIHESVSISGTFKHKIGNTMCLASGNHNIGENLAVLVFDLEKLGEVERVVI
jgi:Icc-related predicted phosphoesterase